MARDDRMKDFHSCRAHAREPIAARHLIDDVIDPADTRGVVIRFLARSRARTAIGRHRLAGRPTTF